jgi:O-antigen/teichoic acid export membrane protein
MALRRFPTISWALADQTMVSGSNFFTTILIARYLGPVEFGRFSLAWMLVLLVASVQFSLIISPMMSIGPKQTESDLSAYYSIVLVHTLILATLAFVLLLGGVTLTAAWFPEWNIEHLALPLACAALAGQLQDFTRRKLFVRGRLVAAFGNDAICYLGKLGGLTLVAHLIPMDSRSLLWLVAATSAIPAVLAIPGHVPFRWNPAFALSVTRRHRRFAGWLLAASSVSWSTASLPMTVAAAALGSWAAGALKAAQTMMGVTNVIVEGTELIALNWAATDFNRAGASGLFTSLRHVTALVGIPTVVVTGLAAASPDLWLRLIFGTGYVGYGELVRWFAVTYLLFALATPMRIGLNAIAHTRPHLVASVLSAVVAMLAVYPLVHAFGISGAAIATMMASAAGTLALALGFWYCMRRIPMAFAPKP